MLRSKHIKYGAPILIFSTGVPFFLKDVFQVRFDYRGHSTANIDEATKFGHARLEQEEKKRIEEGKEPMEKREYRLTTLEEEYEKMEKEYTDTYEMVSESVGGNKHMDTKVIMAAGFKSKARCDLGGLRGHKNGCLRQFAVHMDTRVTKVDFQSEVKLGLRGCLEAQFEDKCS